MKVSVRQMSIVRPAKCTPRHRLWLSNLDIVHPKTHLKTIYIYKEADSQHSTSSDFFDAKMMKDALSKALVPFYPMAGRLGRDNNGRLELDCNGEGVLFQEADVETTINELGEFLHKAEDELTELVPSVDYSKGISSYPLFLLQASPLG
ncbi:unnamed protein product [Linum trigynum]|uniref:Uncharacterized protein n=1 Tax=Linum trigynum TaxID=586398 RepID=A0AAV2CSD1_9ROSI